MVKAKFFKVRQNTYIQSGTSDVKLKRNNKASVKLLFNTESQ